MCTSGIPNKLPTRQGHTASCKKVCHNATIWSQAGQKIMFGDLCSCDMEILREEVDLQDQAFFIVRESASRTIEHSVVYRGLYYIVLQANYMVFKGETYFFDSGASTILGNYSPIRSKRLDVTEGVTELDEALRMFEIERVLDA